MLVATIQIKMNDNSINTNVLVQDDNEIVNAKNSQHVMPGTEKSFKNFLNRLGKLGAYIKIQEF